LCPTVYTLLSLKVYLRQEQKGEMDLRLIYEPPQNSLDESANQSDQTHDGLDDVGDSLVDYGNNCAIYLSEPHPMDNGVRPDGVQRVSLERMTPEVSLSVKHLIMASGGVEVYVASDGLIWTGLKSGARSDGTEFVWGDYFSAPFPIWWYNRRVIGNTRTHECPNYNPYELAKRRKFR